MPTFDSFQTLLDQATGVQPATPVDTKMNVLDRAGQIKKNQVAHASARKQEAMGPGVDSAYNIALAKLSSLGTLGRSDKENDLREMTPGQLYQKYGDQAGSLIKQLAQGTNAVMDTMNTPDRNAGQVTYDTATDVASGFVNAIGGIAALGVGTVTPRGGAVISRKLEEATRLNAAYQSDGLRVRKQLAEDKNALAGRDNIEQRAADISNGDSEFVAGLKSIGREAVNAVSISGSDSAVLGSGVSNAVGSLLAAGPVSKGVKGLAGLAKLEKIGEKIATPVAIGAMESGGTYTQTMNDVMGRSHDRLLAESADYRELVKTMSPDDAKLELANSTALKAAAITAPAAIAAGTLVSKFEGAPLSSMIRKAPGYVLREPVEEGIQGASGQLAQNIAIQGSVDKNQDLAKGVGRQAGEGALYGLGMTAVISIPSAPGIATKAVGKGAGAVGGKVLDYFADAADSRNEANNKASPIADSVVLDAATQAQATAAEAGPILREAVDVTDATPEQKAEANSYVDSLVAANNFDTESDATPDLLKPHLEGVTNRVDAIQRVAQYVNSVEADSKEQMRAGFYLHELMSSYEALVNSDPEAFQKIPEDHQARKIIDQYTGLMGVLGKTPKVMEAIGKIQSALEKYEAKAVEVTEETLATPEGQEAVSEAISVATVAPEKGNLETNQRILFQVTQGKLQITPEQKAALDTSVALLRAVAASDKAAQLAGEADPVSLNISSVDGEKGPSLTQHAKGIMSAWKAGNRDLAAERLVELHNFAKSMSNKVGAINAHFAAGDPKANGVRYQAYRDGEWFDSNTAWKVHTSNLNSVKTVQKIGREAQLLADVYNGLVAAFPDLNGRHLDVTPLDPNLSIPAKDVVAKHTQPTVTTSPESAPTPVTENTINIWYGSNENAELSNIAERPFQYRGVNYFSVEHAYQSLKSGAFDQTTYDKYKAGNQKIAGKKGTKTDNHWNLRLMRVLVLESFKQNPAAKKALLATGDAKFSHTQDNGIWKTEFPRILESVRKTLRTTPDVTPTAPTPQPQQPEAATSSTEEVASGFKASTDENPLVREARDAVRKALIAMNFKFTDQPNAPDVMEIERIASKILNGLDNDDPAFIKDAAKALSYALFAELGATERSGATRAWIEESLAHWLMTGKAPAQENKPGLWVKVMEIYKRLMSFFQSEKYEKIHVRLERMINDIRTGKKDFSFKPKEGFSKLDFQTEMDNNPDAVKVLLALTEAGVNFTLTGSVAYSDQVPVYRKKGQPLHDIDLLMSESEIETAQEQLQQAGFGKGVVLYSFKPNGRTVVGLAVVPAGYEIRNKVSGWRVKNNAVHRSYDVFETATNKQVGRYSFEAKSHETFEGIAGVTVDLMSSGDIKTSPQEFTANGKRHTLQVARYEHGFSKKLEMLRYKDIHDYLAVVPPSPSTTAPAPAPAPAAPATQSQQESQIPQGVENNTPRKGPSSSLVPIEAAVDSVKEVAQLVKELDSTEESIKNTTDEATLNELEEKAEDLFDAISEKVDEIINELIDQLVNIPSLVADGIRDELNDLKESEEEPKVKLRDLSNILRLARKISNSTEDMFGDTSSVTTTQSQEPDVTPLAVKTSSTPTTPDLPYKKVVWNKVVAYDAFDGMKPGDWKVFENGFGDSHAFNYLTPSGQKIAGDFEIIGNQIINFNITSETGKGGATGPVLKVVMKNLFRDFPQATRLHGFRISGMRDNSPGVSEVNFKIENGRLIAIRKPSSVPGGSTSQSQQPPSSTPTFDGLPVKDPETLTMTYAGIGSRETPQAVLDQMTAYAERLEGLGYTLRSGGAKGADSAFEKGAQTKQIFYANDATDQTRQIAREIHPKPDALKGYGLNLMARNTNQLFGKNLDTPVDFVLAWTPDGVETSADRTIKSGGTGQAIDMASGKGIPVFNLATADGQARFEAYLGTVAKKKAKSTNTNGAPTQSILQRADSVLKAIKNKPHHEYGDTTLESLVDMYKKGLFEYKVGKTLHQVPFDERIITTALDIYESNLAAWEAAIKAGLDIDSHSVSKEQQAILDSAPHTETVDQLFTRVAEVYAAQNKKITQIDPQSISDGKPFDSGKLPLAQLGVKKGTPFLNYDVCHACSANTVKQLREAGISAANPTIAQRDVSGHSDRMGDHKVALVRVNDTVYIVDQPQAEIFAPLSPTVANKMMPKVGEFSPRFIEVTPENLVKLYGYTPNSARLTKAVSKLKGIDSFDAAIPANIDNVISSISVKPASNNADQSVVGHEIASSPNSFADEIVTPVLKETLSNPEEDSNKGLAFLFPKLAGVTNGFFSKAFQFPKKQKTRTLGTETPIEFLREALRSSTSLTALLGSPPKGKFTKEAATEYAGLLDRAEEIISKLSENLSEKLDKAYKNTTIRAVALGNASVVTEAGTEYDPFRTADTKSLNITEAINGTLEYNPELIQGAVLAGLQWFIEADEYESMLDDADVASLTGIPVGMVTTSMVDAMNQGMSTLVAKGTLSDKIVSYWGLDKQRTGSIGMQEGIPQALAGEILRAFRDIGLLSTVSYAVTETGEFLPYKSGDKKPAGTVKVLDQHVPTPLAEKSAIRAFPKALDLAVLVEPEDKIYIGEDVRPPVAATQMRNPDVKNTPEQLETIKNEQETPYFLNLPMVNLFLNMGTGALLDLFAEGDLSKKVMNRNHRTAAESQSKALTSAVQSLRDTQERVLNQAEGTPLDQVPIRYGFNMTRVSRLQMLGKYTPQANTLIREAILPTRSTLDLSSETGRDFNRFALAQAQALGIKVHQKTMPSTRKALAKIMTDLAPSIQLLESWVDAKGELPASLVNTLKSDFAKAGVGLTPVALHALMEQARYNKLSDRSAFTTSLYVEADGVSNGPINAMILFTVGLFNSNWIKNVAKGGLFINQQDMTVNKHFSSVDSEDLYGNTSNGLQNNISKMRNLFKKNNKEAAANLDHLLELMDLFLGSDLTFSNGKITIKRGLAKNPLTITIYGSGAKGIAGNLVGALSDAMYERMSQVAQARVDANGQISIAEAMFGPQSASVKDAEAKMDRFIKAFKNLSTTEATFWDGEISFARNGIPISSIDPETFTLTKEQVGNLQSNMLVLFVKPLNQAIRSTVGDSLMDSVTTLRKATQVQSIFLEYAFKNAVAAKLEEKAKDPNWNRNEFLTVEEVDKIKEEFSHLAPMVKTEDQTFYIAGGQTSPVGAVTYGSALNGTFRSDPYLHAPKNASVSGIPFMTIGTGDGLMMQLISTMKNAISGTLKIFDGMNMPLDRMEEGSEQANRAVLESWTRNPMKAVYESYNAFYEAADLDNISPEMLKDLNDSLIGPGQEVEPVEVIQRVMKQLRDTLNRTQQSIEARHRTMMAVDLSVDQMAATGVPYNHKGTIQLDGTDPASLAQQLNVIYLKELAAIQQAERVGRNLKGEYHKLGTQQESGAWVLEASELNKITTQLPKNQAAILSGVIDSMAIEGYKVVFGTPEEIAQYNVDNGLFGMGEHPGGVVEGYTNIDSKVIYLHNSGSEVLTHELTHASTFLAVLSHYKGKASRRASLAVLRIEALMGQFLELGPSLNHVSTSVRGSYADAVATIQGYLEQDTAEGKASALNEFMAWTLANEALSTIAKNTAATKLGRIKESVLRVIRSMLGIQATAQNDILSNLLFNSSILMKEQATIRERFTRTVLFQNSIYGEDARLIKVNESLNKLIGRYLTEAPDRAKQDPDSALKTGIIQAIRVSDSFVGHGFNMNMQELSTFKTIVSVLATEAKIDPNAMTAAQELYTHTMKRLSYQDFMADPDSTNPNDEAIAREKFDVLSGKYLVAQDGGGRSTLMPAFLALATVSPEFRAVLAKIDLPKSAHKTAGTLDALLENNGNKVMDALSKRMSGISSKATNVQDAIDDLHAHIGEIINTRETFYDQMASKAGGLLDRSNEIVTDGMKKLSGYLLAAAKKSQREDSSKLEKLVTGIGAGIASVLDDEVAGVVADDFMGAINKSNMWTPIRELLGELVGRTESNANIYDMIKSVLSVVQQTRQQYREHLPILIAGKFSRELTKEEWASLHRSLGKTDIAVLRRDYSNAEIMNMVSKPAELAKAIASLENQVRTADSVNFPAVKAKMEQLAHFMLTKEPGNVLLRNAEAVATLATGTLEKRAAPYIRQVDELTSLYALQGLSQSDKDTFASLVQDQAEGLGFVMAYLDGQRQEEARKTTTAKARLNSYKGFIPDQQDAGVTILVADDTQYSNLIGKSYQRIGDYAGSSLENGIKRGYYFLPAASRATFEQGIMQNVRQTVGGVDATTGQTIAQTAGVITDPITVRRLAARMRNSQGKESLMPIFNEAGTVVAFERSLDPVMMERLGTESDLAKTMGIWRGRQVEEAFAQFYNEALVDRLKMMVDSDLRENPDNSRQYVDVYASKDPVVKNAVALFTPDTKAYIEEVFGERFMVRKDMLNDALGYHAASVGDFWTGNGRWSPETQKAVRNIATAVFGNQAYKTMLTAEKTIQNIVSDARVLIVVKSVIVPVSNLISNVYQLISRGVPIASIILGMPKKTAEIEAYTRSRVRQIEAEAELRAAVGNASLERRLKTELQSIKDSHTRLSIWPLLQAGEFSGISDAGLIRSDVELTSGRLQAYLEGAAQKLPGWGATMGRYALVTKDTALFQGLQKAVEYGDFLAKAILYDDLTERKGMSQADALARITEEFVNYNRLSGRFRGAMENMGLLWFYNFKIRIAKIALSTIRNNPVHALLAGSLPTPSIFGGVGLPMEENMFAKLADGTLDNSMGPGQGISSMALNPWINLTQ